MEKIKNINAKRKGVTLITLVITIIVMLILAGITINLTIGEEGIIKKAQEAGENMLLAQEKEKRELNELYSSLLVATNDNSKVTISVEDLKTLIKSEVETQLEKNNQQLHPTAHIYYNANTVSHYAYLNLTSFTSDYSDYYTNNNGEINILKEGKYLVEVGLTSSGASTEVVFLSTLFANHRISAGGSQGELNPTNTNSFLLEVGEEGYTISLPQMNISGSVDTLGLNVTILKL